MRHGTGFGHALRIGVAMGLLTWLLVLGPPTLLSQVISGTIFGRVVDPSGAVVPGATVTVINQETNVKVTSVSNGQGDYVVALLPIATYTVTASKEGFKLSTVSDIRVTAGSSSRVDLSLVVGSANQTVQVSATAAHLQTTSSAVGLSIEGREVRELPLPGRDILRLATLGPGAVQGQTSSIQYLTNSYLGSNVPTIAGGRRESESFTFGGLDVNNRRLNLPVEKPNLDSVAEFTVLSDNYSAEYGQGDGQIIVEYRSGTNKFHGSVYDFLRNDALNARGLFDVKKPPLRYNQFGAAVGGPIRSDKTFFFANYEGIKNPSSSTDSGLFPTQGMLNGDFSNFKDSAGNVIPIYDPATTDPITGLRQQFPGNLIPSNRISPIAKSLYALYGAPTASTYIPGGSNNVTTTVPGRFLVDQLAVKIDQDFARGDTLSTRYSFSDPRTFSGNITAAAENTEDLRNQILGETWTHSFSPTLLNELRLGWVRERDINIPPLAASKDLQQLAGFTNPLPYNAIPTVFFQSDTGTPSFNQLNGVSAGGGGEVQQVFQIVDNLSFVKGKHIFKFGTDLRRRHWDTIGTLPTGGGSLRDSGFFTSQLQPDPAKPGYFGAVTGTGSGLADFLLGDLTGVDFGLGLNIFSYRDNEISWFGQDTWRVTPRLTLSIGLRWDYQSPISEKHGRESWFIADSRCPAGCLVNDGQFGGTYDPIVNPFPGKPAIRNGGWNPDLNNFGPRISLAYRVLPSTVFRAGYGVFYSLFGENNFPGATNPPFGTGYNINSAVNDGTGDTSPLSQLMSSKYAINAIYPPGQPLGQTKPGTLGLGFYYDTHTVQPEIIDTSAAVQHAFSPTLTAEIGYMGSFGRNLSNFLSIDSCSPRPCTRPYPNFSSAALIEPNALSSYNAGYIKVEKRFSQGLSFLGSWTYSRDISTGGDSEGNDIFLGSAGGLFNIHAIPKHLSVLDVPHRAVISGIYELPFGRGKRFLDSASPGLDRLVGGWQTSWVTAFESGTALDLSSFGVACFANANAPHELRRMDYRKTGYFFDPNLFIDCPSSGGIQIPYNSFRGAGINDWDISLQKYIPIKESQRLLIRADFFNAWNHAQFETPGHVIFFPGFGKFQAREPGFFEFGSRPPRNIEVALKYEF